MPAVDVLFSHAAFASFLDIFAVFAEAEVVTPPTVVLQVQVNTFLQEGNIVASAATAIIGISFFIFCLF